MRVIYRKIRHARYLYINRNVEKVWGARYTLGARYLSKNTVVMLHFLLTVQPHPLLCKLVLWDLESVKFSITFVPFCPNMYRSHVLLLGRMETLSPIPFT